MKSSLLAVLILAAPMIILQPAGTVAQEFIEGPVIRGGFRLQDPFGGPAVAPQEEGGDESPMDEAETVIEIDRTGTAIPPNVMRLTLLDGTIITGELDQDTVSIATEFGNLDIPVERIRRLRPGLRSYPELRAKIFQLIEDLGGNDFEAREQAQKQLLAYGLKIQNILKAPTVGDNLERKRRLDAIRAAMEGMIEEQELLGDGLADEPWVEWDVIETDVFDIAGAVELDQLKITSRYGQLNVSLSDLQMADRMFGGKEPTSRALVVDGSNLPQREYKSSQLRVERGDRITVVAEGQIVMSPWGSNQMASPDGNSYYGMYNQFPGGALIARIGNNGSEFLVGKRKTWIAEASGVLKFAVSMQNDYSGGGYNFPGQYTLRIKVEPQ